MKPIHLWWIIPLSIIFGFLIGFYVDIPNEITLTMEYGDNVIEALKLMNNTIK